MKKMAFFVVLAAVLVLAGCESKELVTCRQDNQKLQNDLTAANATIEKQKSDNADIQNKAMESIMTMLKKEEEQRKKLQATVAEKDTQLKTAQQQADALKAQLDAANKAVEQLKAAPAPAVPAEPVAQ